MDFSEWLNQSSQLSHGLVEGDEGSFLPWSSLVEGDEGQFLPWSSLFGGDEGLFLTNW